MATAHLCSLRLLYIVQISGAAWGNGAEVQRLAWLAVPDVVSPRCTSKSNFFDDSVSVKTIDGWKELRWGAENEVLKPSPLHAISMN